MFEVAGSGTLFLDEIGNISMSIQAKLLRVLQEREFRAVGDTRTQVANFRLVTATNKDLKAMVAAGTFRDDLYYRINIFPIHAPALRERKGDIPALAYHFLKVFSAELGKKITDISEGALSTLVNYGWPGNVRELENVMHRAAILTNDNVIRQAHLVNIVDTVAVAGRPRGAAHRRRAQAGQKGRARKVGGGDREAVRARGAQAQRLERDQKRRGNRHAASELPGADEEIRDPRARHRARRRR